MNKRRAVAKPRSFGYQVAAAVPNRTDCAAGSPTGPAHCREELCRVAKRELSGERSELVVRSAWA